MKKIFLLEYKKNLFSILFLLSVIILIIIYITQCLPRKWMYYKQPMNQEEFIYERLREDQKHTATEIIKGYMYNSKLNIVQKKTIFKKINIDKKGLDYINTILIKLNQDNQIVSYDGFEEDLSYLNILLGGKSYYEKSSIISLYERYLREAFGTLPLENTHELCEEMYTYLHDSIEKERYIFYSVDVFQTMKKYSKKELEKVYEIAQDIDQIYRNYSSNEEIKYQNMLICFNQIAELLGENSVFSEKYRDQYFKKVYSLNDIKQQYKIMIEDEKLTNAYARYYADYMTVFGGLLSAIFGAFSLWYDERYKVQDIIFSKKISSFQYLFLKFAVIIALFFTIYIVIAGVSTGLFFIFAKIEKIAIDYLAFFKYMIGWVMPTVCVTTASSMLIFIVFNNPIPVLMLELIVFFLSSKDLCGNYFLWKPIIRFNEIGRYDYFIEHLWEIIINRIVMSGLSIFILWFCSILYERKRKGRTMVNVERMMGEK